MEKTTLYCDICGCKIENKHHCGAKAYLKLYCGSDSFSNVSKEYQLDDLCIDCGSKIEEGLNKLGVKPKWT